MLDKHKYKSIFFWLLLEQTCSLQFLLTVTLGQSSQIQALALTIFLQSKFTAQISLDSPLGSL